MVEDHDASEIDLSALFEAAAERDPQLSSFCIVCSDEGVHARGKYSAFWFDSVTDLTLFLRRVVPVMAEERYDEIVSEVEQILASVDEQGMLEEHVLHLADLLGGALHFRWAGTFEDLCEGPSSVACDLRSQFRAGDPDQETWDDEDEPDDDRAVDDPEREIGVGEVDAFAVFLMELRN